jgi:mannosyltransferase OCH1-like enzyme
MIPKKIHYIWLGGKAKPKSFELALHSWQQYTPEYEILEWNESNITEFALPPRFDLLLSAKKWAFASDILRFHILEKYGGLYFDVDQVLVKELPNSFLEYSFCISSYHQVDDYYGFGLFGSQAGGIVIQNLQREMDAYQGADIIVNKIGSTVINKLKLEQVLGLEIFPQAYFYPLTRKDFTDNTYSYHLSNTSWIPWYKKVLHKIPGYIHMQKVAKKLLPGFIKKRLFKIEYL